MRSLRFPLSSLVGESTMPGWLATTLFVFARVAALVVVVPGVSQRFVPWRARCLLVALISIPVLCVIPPIAEEVAPGSIPAIMFHELMVGLSLGLVPAAIVFGLQIAVQALNGMTGLPGGPSTESLATASALQRLLFATVLTVFFLSSGHRVVIQSVMDSFRWLPPGSYSPLQSVGEILLDLLSASFALGVRAMTPVAASLAISLMALAAINRIVPQFGYFTVGMSVQSLVLIGSMILFCGGIVWFLEESFTSTDSFKLAWQSAIQKVGGP